MKNIKLSLLFLLAFLSYGCNSILDKTPLDEIGDDAFWADPTLVDYYVNNLYSTIYLDQRLEQENRTDNSVSAQRDKFRASTYLFNYNLVSATEPNDNIWNGHYEKIRK